MIGRIRSSRDSYREYAREALRRRYAPADRRTLPKDPAAAESQRNAIRTRRGTTELVRAFWGHVRCHRRALSIVLLTSAFATVAGLLPPYGMKLIFDNVFSGKALPDILARLKLVPASSSALLWTVVFAMLGLSVLSVVARTYSNSLAYRLQKHIILRTRRRLFQHTLQLPLHRLRQITSGGLAFIVRHDANAVGDLVVFLIYEPWKAIIQLLGCFVVLVWVDWHLLAISLALLPLLYIAQRARVGRIRDIAEDASAQDQQLDGQTAELFGGVRVIRGFGRESTVTARLLRRHNFVFRLQLLSWWLYRSVDVGWMILIPLASTLLLGFGGSRVLHDAARVAAGEISPADAFSVGSLIMFMAYLAWLLNPLATLARTSTHLQNALAGMSRALDVLEEPVEMSSRGPIRDIRPSPCHGAIALDDVWFTYPGAAEPSLRGIDLDVPAGHTVALVGPSGAGKSTLTNLIARFYNPDRGTVRLDGVDVREIDVRLFRRTLALVEQDIFLFDGTIGENIACGNRRASREQVIEAAKRAHAHEFIADLPQGYDTPVGERGLRFSGGQRQRIAIARAMLAEPKILVLDEATSHLDPENERLIQRSLASLMSGRTCFVIAHRLSTIRHADQIIMIEDGRITERGRHEDLMLASGRYRRMVELQVGVDELSPVSPCTSSPGSTSP
jgi:ATP-binding cassette subfamily B protein/subfamily B ATP-binding cassette protein MsbA